MKRFFEYLSPTIEAEQKNTRTHITLVKAMTDGLFSLFRPITETLALASAWLKHNNQSAKKNILIEATKQFTANNNNNSISENASMSVIKNAISQTSLNSQPQENTGPTKKEQAVAGTIEVTSPDRDKAAELEEAKSTINHKSSMHTVPGIIQLTSPNSNQTPKLQTAQSANEQKSNQATKRHEHLKNELAKLRALSNDLSNNNKPKKR